MERILYNGFAAAISTEGDRFFYVNPLQRRADHYEKDDPGRRREWFKCACCPPNIMRLLASLHHYLATEADDTLYLHQYATARVAGAGLEIEAETDYPWDGLITLRVLSAPGDEREIALRVPVWSPTALLTVNQGPAERLRVPPPLLPARPPGVAAGRRGTPAPGHGAALDVPRPPGGRDPWLRRDRARPARLLLRAGRPGGTARRAHALPGSGRGQRGVFRRPSPR